MTQRLRVGASLTVLVVIALALRGPGMEWGLPDAIHADYSYHPDEAFSLGWGDDLYHGYVIPRHFIYGGTFYYRTLGYANRLAEWFSHDATTATRILYARYLSLGYALLSVVLIYFAARTFFTHQVGLISAFVLAIAPGHVIWAQRGRPDELFVLLVTLNLVFIARLLKQRGKQPWNVALGGLCLGVAVATRFPAGALVFGYIAAISYATAQPREWQAVVKPLGGLALCTVAFYSIGSPHTWLYFRYFVEGISMQWTYQSSPFIDGIGRGFGWWQYGGRIFSQAIEYGYYLPALLALAFTVTRRRSSDLVLLAASVPYFILLAMTSWIVVRYFIPLLPVIAILTARFVVVAYRMRWPIVRRTVVAVVIAASLINLAAIAAYTTAVAAPDVRDTTLAWMSQHIPPGTDIGVFQQYRGDTFFNPPGIVRFNWSVCVFQECDVGTFLRRGPEYLIIPDEYLHDAIRLGRRHPVEANRQLVTWLDTQSLYTTVFTGGQRLELLSFDFSSQFDAFDIRIALPTLYILQRRPDIRGIVSP